MAGRAPVAAFLLTFCSQLAAGQDVLTLDRAVGDALEHSRALSAAKAGADEASAREDDARSRFFPRVSVTESWQRGDHPVFVFSSLLAARQFAAPNFAIDALNHPGPTGFFHGAFGIEQLIFDGGRLRAGVDAARSGRASADAAVEEMSAALALNVTRTYGQLLRVESGRRAVDSALEAAREDVARAQRRRDAGTVTEADVLSLAVHVADLRQRAIQAEGDVAILRAQLNRLMGAPVTRTFAVQEPAIAETAAPKDLEALIAEAEAARPELKRTAAAVSLAEAGTRQARAAWMPQVAAQAGYQLDGTALTTRASSWIVGGEVRWSLSTGGAEAAGARASRGALARARAEDADARAAVQVDVLTALRHLESAQARQAVAAATVDQARESQRIIRDRYDLGLAAVNDVLRAAAAALDADAQRTSTLVDRLEAAAALVRALGRTR
jgi:outer membrane protein TolC